MSQIIVALAPFALVVIAVVLLIVLRAQQHRQDERDHEIRMDALKRWPK